MHNEPVTPLNTSANATKAAIVTLHGEHQTLWHIVDLDARESDQPAVIRTFSSITATREEAKMWLESQHTTPRG